ncbi:hypothetical protein [Undibacterium sp. Ji49W]|uniref:hypothetical protein n=1 Tax=Undibacterium sp. Ji49W TaxID=3413040 RepID=UPI003BF5F856
MTNYVFTIPYDRRGNAVGQFTSLPLPPIDPANGLPYFCDGDTITYQYNFIEHGINQGSDYSVISESQICATPGNVNGTGPFPPDGAYTYDLNAANNFTVALINNTIKTDKWRIQGSFLSTLTNPGVTVKWDPECDVGPGT